MREQWRIKELLEWTTDYFREKKVAEPRLEAEILLARVLDSSRVYLYSHFDRPVNREEREKFREFIKRRARGEPTAYIVGSKEFMSLDFLVSDAILIPRPETELLVEQAIALAPTLDRGNLRICDVGTGSGAIAISLGVYLKGASIIAIDNSIDALDIARKNATRHSVEIEFLQGDLLEPVKAGKPFDMITANLPYISPEEFERLEPSVAKYEPVSALLAPGDGLDLYRRLLPQAIKLLKPGGYLLMEIGYEQGAAALQMFDSRREFVRVYMEQDLAGRDRLIIAQKEH
ncbi:MAG: peptide chain release factor N(5)-glutamine methyltransferase [Syntrophomonadaceae bacterium]|jgi:release factor glutamine methyltransferase